MNNENNIILYQDDNKITRVSVRFADEYLWLIHNSLHPRTYSFLLQT